MIEKLPVVKLGVKNRHQNDGRTLVIIRFCQKGSKLAGYVLGGCYPLYLFKIVHILDSW